MCLIIQKPADVTLNYEKFCVAVKNNDDGYGLSYPDPDKPGKLITIRDHRKIDTDKVFKFINEDLKSIRAMVHLRYTTAGKTILRNAHPFPILEYKTDGVDLRMAHNGTLFSYKPSNGSGESDTRVFVREFIRPLFKRLIRGNSIEELLKDPWLAKLIKGELTPKSVVTFLDGYGHTLEVNPLGNGGEYLTCGAYFSNKYSFDPDHRNDNWTGYGGGYGQGYGFRGGTNSHFKGQQSHQKPDKSLEEKKADRQEKQRRDNLISPKHAEDTQVERFTEKYSISRDDLLDMDDDMIEMLAEGADQKEAVVLLIKELLLELAKYEGESDE